MPSARSPLAELLADLARALHRLGGRWYLFGAQAAIIHGAVRLTADVDVTVEPRGSLADLVTALGGAGFDGRVEGLIAFAEEHRVLPLVHARTRMPVDVVLAGPGLEERFLARAVTRTIEDVSVPVASAEDIVVMKVLAGRAKDLEDVAAIVRAQPGTLDLAMVRDVLRQIEEALGRRDLLAGLDRALARSRSEPDRPASADRTPGR